MNTASNLPAAMNAEEIIQSIDTLRPPEIVQTILPPIRAFASLVGRGQGLCNEVTIERSVTSFVEYLMEDTAYDVRQNIDLFRQSPDTFLLSSAGYVHYLRCLMESDQISVRRRATLAMRLQHMRNTLEVEYIRKEGREGVVQSEGKSL